jgi:hypothetical protein
MGQSQPQPQPRPGPPASIDLVWEEAHAVAEAQERRHDALDSKTLPLLAFGLTFEAFLWATPTGPFDPVVRNVLSGLVTMGLLATLAAVIPRKWSRVPDLKTFASDANWEPSRLKERYLGNFVHAWVANETVIKRRFRWFKLAVILYAVSLTVGTATTIWPYG